MNVHYGFEKMISIAPMDSKKQLQLYKAANKPPTPPKNTSKSSPVSEKTPISDAYLLAQTDLPVNIIINGSSSITMSPKDLVKKIPLKIGENIVQVKPIDNGPGGFERTIKVNKSKNTILVINILAQKKNNTRTTKANRNYPKQNKYFPERGSPTRNHRRKAQIRDLDR
ncbi:MAG: hypothetical protein R2822_27185 [Spirosomataceae bacterium]